MIHEDFSTLPQGWDSSSYENYYISLSACRSQSEILSKIIHSLDPVEQREVATLDDFTAFFCAWLRKFKNDRRCYVYIFGLSEAIERECIICLDLIELMASYSSIMQGFRAENEDDLFASSRVVWITWVLGPLPIT